MGTDVASELRHHHAFNDMLSSVSLSAKTASYYSMQLIQCVLRAVQSVSVNLHATNSELHWMAEPSNAYIALPRWPWLCRSHAYGT